MVVYAGQGDARRSMSLLWRASRSTPQRSGPGPKPGLSVDVIVAAGIEVADSNGMDGLSMRAVGDRLGRTAMALYTYVPSKAELLDLMYDHALGELPTGYDTHAGWRDAVLAVAHDLWALYLRHPWMLHVSQARPVLGPNEFAVQETIMSIVERTGLAPMRMRHAVGALLQFVRAAAHSVAETRWAAADTGRSDDEWWFARSAELEQTAPDFADRFPTLTRLANAGAFQLADETRPYLEQAAMETFDAGLALLLDGIEARLG